MNNYQMTLLMRRLLDNIEAEKYLDEINRNDYNKATRWGWGFGSENGDERLSAIHSRLYADRRAIIEEINNLSGLPFKTT